MSRGLSGLGNVRESLKPGGKFIIDVMGKEILAKILQDYHCQEEDGALIVQKSKVSRNWTWVESNWIILRDKKYDMINVSHGIYSANELMCLLEECGLPVVNVYGGFDASPYDNHAWRLIIIAEKS